jgi:hypothetical protein
MASAVTVKETTVNELRELLQREPNTLFALFDSAGEERVPPKMMALGDRATCLFQGKAASQHVNVAPYLALVDEDLLDWIIANLWKGPWGIFIVANANLEDLRGHFRRFLIALDPKGNPFYFCYYDPRVLPMFLETCVQTEVDEFFGRAVRFVCSRTENELICVERVDFKDET